MGRIDKDSRRQKLKALGLDEQCEFPMKDYASISTDCTRYGKIWGKQFSMRSNNEARTVTVTRTA